ncbi:MULTISPECIES: hypothetical protein [Mycolicibacterium]|uniref:hypothetical protein n=1 Tax=Mycolicibacterium TaxID=1866885 RepID=UPI001CDD306D|nr:hypothetical protein [Mycolicibacterium fortuitum]UBV21681.1 hypothetical protein H8Z59_00015 [Mycolicibacterium fortuitum]
MANRDTHPIIGAHAGGQANSYGCLGTVSSDGQKQRNKHGAARDEWEPHRGQ